MRKYYWAGAAALLIGFFIAMSFLATEVNRVSPAQYAGCEVLAENDGIGNVITSCGTFDIGNTDPSLYQLGAVLSFNAINGSPPIIVKIIN